MIADSVIIMASSTFETLAVRLDEDMVAVLELARPKKRNAMDSRFWRDFPLAVEACVAAGARVIVVCGQGACFSAGLDTSDESLIQFQEDADVARMGLAKKRQVCRLAQGAVRRLLVQPPPPPPPPPLPLPLPPLPPQVRMMQDCLTASETAPVPVIAAVHGPCVGAGVDLITACDVRLCSSDSYFSVREVRLGLAADVGTLQVRRSATVRNHPPRHKRAHRPTKLLDPLLLRSGCRKWSATSRFCVSFASRVTILTRRQPRRWAWCRG